MKTNGLGLARLQPGDVVVAMGNRKWVTLYVTDSNATVAPLESKVVVIEPRFGKRRQFQSAGGVDHISAHAEPQSIERRGKEFLEDFLAGKKAYRKEQTTQAGTTSATSEEDMKKGSKKNKTTKAEGSTTTSKGALGEIFGCSITSVLRRLGKEGVTSAHARAIMKAKGLTVADGTVQIQIGNGRNGKGDPAALTKEQVKELVNLAPEPEAEPAKAAA